MGGAGVGRRAGVAFWSMLVPAASRPRIRDVGWKCASNVGIFSPLVPVHIPTVSSAFVSFLSQCPPLFWGRSLFLVVYGRPRSPWHSLSV